MIAVRALSPSLGEPQRLAKIVAASATRVRGTQQATRTNSWK